MLEVTVRIEAAIEFEACLTLWSDFANGFRLTEITTAHVHLGVLHN